MPKALTINHTLVCALFAYNPLTGNLTPKPTANAAARRINSKQWEFGAGTHAGIYSMHRIVWAYHNPDDANPRYIRFRDGDQRNTRIENLYAKNTHPRWEGYTKQSDAQFDEYGRVVWPDTCVEASDGALIPKHLLATMSAEDRERFGVDGTRTPEPQNPHTDASWADDFELPNPKPKPRNSDGTDYDYQ